MDNKDYGNLIPEFPQELLGHSTLVVDGIAYQLTDSLQDADASQYPVVATAPAVDANGAAYLLQWVELDTYNPNANPWDEGHSRYDFQHPAHAIPVK